MSDNLFASLDKTFAPIQFENENKIKYIDTPISNFKDFYQSGNRLYQNYDTDTQNDLTYGQDTRRQSTNNQQSTNNRQSIPRPVISAKKTSNKKSSNTSTDEISNILDTDIELKLGRLMINPTLGSQNQNQIKTSAARLPKESDEYWDNTKRHNLNTSIYTNNPSKIGGRGFGDVQKYDQFKNHIGVSTRQENPDIKPQNIDNDRIYQPNHNYASVEFHVPKNLGCGADTRYLNKKTM